MLLAVLTQVVQLPRIVEREEDGKGVTKKSLKPEFKHRRSVLLFTSMMIALCFFIDGSLEGFLSLYLRSILQSGPLLGGIGIASLHFSSMIGRLSSTTMIKKVGESRILIFSGLIASIGITVVTFTSSPRIAACALLGVGIALSPIAPISFSLASRVAPAWGARSVSIVTGAGYLSFVIGPVMIGKVADSHSLQKAFTLLLISSVIILLLAILWNIGKGWEDPPASACAADPAYLIGNLHIKKLSVKTLSFFNETTVLSRSCSLVSTC